jgi:hypothetical protein
MSNSYSDSAIGMLLQNTGVKRYSLLNERNKNEMACHLEKLQ